MTNGTKDSVGGTYIGIADNKEWNYVIECHSITYD